MAKHLTKQHRNNISKALRGKPKPRGFGQKISLALKGKPLSPQLHYQRSQTMKRLRKYLYKLHGGFLWTGRKHSVESRKRMSDSKKGIPTHRQTMLGKKHSIEARKKMSLAHMGNKYNLGHKASKEARYKMSQAQKGNKYRLGIPHTAEAKKKMSLKSTGRKHTPETRYKISQANKGHRNAMWRGGKHLYRGDGWTRPRQKEIRIRDNFTCLRCNLQAIKSRIQNNHDVHHIIPYRYRKQYNISEPNANRNLITLCKQCHGWAETHLDQSIPQLQKILSKKYGYKYH